MNNFFLCINAVLPMFVLMIIGFSIRRVIDISSAEIRKMNKFIFITCYPAIMFENLYGANLEETLNWKLVIFAVCSIFIILLISIPIVLKVEESSGSRGAMIQGIFRSNFVIIGLPIAINICGKGNVSTTALLIAIIVPMYNILAVIVLEFFRGGKANFRVIIKGILTNPLIIGGMVGIFFVVTQIEIPNSVDKIISDISVTATTMALILLGVSFDFKSVKRFKKDLIISVAGRLVVVPGIFLPMAAIMGFRGVEFVTLVAMLASPMAIASYTMAESMDSNGELAGNCVIFSSALSCITIFIWLLIFKNLGIF